MKNKCAFILYRMIRAFQNWPCYIEPHEKKDYEETRLLTYSETETGHSAIILFKDEPYVINIRPIKSEVEVTAGSKTAEEIFPFKMDNDFAAKVCGFNLGSRN